MGTSYNAVIGTGVHVPYTCSIKVEVKRCKQHPKETKGDFCRHCGSPLEKTLVTEPVSFDNLCSALSKSYTDITVYNHSKGFLIYSDKNVNSCDFYDIQKVTSEVLNSTEATESNQYLVDVLKKAGVTEIVPYNEPTLWLEAW